MCIVVSIICGVRTSFGKRSAAKDTGKGGSNSLCDKIRKIWNIVTTVIITEVVIFVVLLFGFRIFGLQGFTVLSGSMEPDYPTGSVIYVKEVDPNLLENHTVITYRLSGQTVATHRIIEIVEQNGSRLYRTKGDANEFADGSLVSPDQIIGTPVITIPFLGYLMTYIQSPSGMYAAIAVGAAILLLLFLPELIFPDKKKKS
jgi:signal peptidase